MRRPFQEDKVQTLKKQFIVAASGSTRKGYMVTRHTNLNHDQRKKIEEKLREIQPETPPFVFVMRGSTAALPVPACREFAVAQLPRATQAVRLRWPGMSCSWEEELKVGTRQGAPADEGVEALRRRQRAAGRGHVPLPASRRRSPRRGGGGGGGELAMNVHVVRGLFKPELQDPIIAGVEALLQAAQRILGEQAQSGTRQLPSVQENNNEDEE
ncbi:hypothetical protein ACP4OV_022879 [Aristida adscensionis]